MLIDKNYSVRNRSNQMKNELKYLSKTECEIIMKLRTEYINLNNYKYYINNHKNGMCKHCNVSENVSHYLIDCTGFTQYQQGMNKNNTDYNKIRKNLRKNLRKICKFFKYEKNFNQ